MNPSFDRYLTNDELAATLATLAERYPHLVELRTLGRSHEGREIALVVVTHRATGSDREKPALWVDANIHATELTGSAAALHLIARLAEGHGNDATITRLLDEQAFYVVPRLNPDGAALAQANPPRFIRSGTRAYPFAERREGLHAEDLDGDGRILQMRIPDPAGDWKVHADDARRMVKRGPDEHGGAYYRLFSEGRVEGYDGHMLKTAPSHQGLDFNRNYPSSWRPEGQQRGAGDYPGSEPEIRAVLDHFASHRNIFGALAYHTFSRVILRPFSAKPDTDLDTHDLWTYQAIGERGTALTGYPNVSCFEDFKYHPKEVITGVFDDWLFDHKGIFAFVVELWDLPDAAGCAEKNEKKKFIEWFRKHPPEDDDKIAAFVDKHAPGALVQWCPFEHPDLGPVELGGYETMYTFRNPPPALLEAEISKVTAFALAFAAMAPRIQWREVDVLPVGDGCFRVRAVIENTGFLPTNASKQALTMKAVEPVRIELSLPEGAALEAGKARTELGQLEGRSHRPQLSFLWVSSDTDNRAKAEWLVRAPQGGSLTLTAVAERAGTIRKDVSLA